MSLDFEVACAHVVTSRGVDLALVDVAVTRARTRPQSRLERAHVLAELIDDALDYYDRIGIGSPHADIARIRAALTGKAPS